jgi:hypothetical protein
VLFKGRNQSEQSLELISERALRNRIENGYIERLRKNGPGSPTLLTFDTLPPAWQRDLKEEFGEPGAIIKKDWFRKKYKQDTEAMLFYQAYRRSNGHSLSDEEVDRYTLNASVMKTVQAVYEARKSLRKAMKGKVTDVWGIVVNECNRFKEVVPHTLPEHPNGLRRKLRSYRKEGYKTFIHKNIENRNALKVDEHVIDLLNNLFSEAKRKPTATEIAGQYEGFLDGYVELINSETGEMYNPKGFPRLSKSTVQAYMARWENRASNETKRSGDRQKLMNKYKPYHSLEQPKYAGSIISIDDRQPPFEYVKGKRAWFYNGIDLGSEAFTVWVHGKSKDGIIMEFYRQLVRNYVQWGVNLPAELEAESSLNASFKNTFLKEGSMFEHVRIEANNARGKRIEAYFRPLRYQYEKQREGWLARPFAGSESNQIGPGKVPQLSFDTIIKNSLKDIETWNNTEHSKIKGKTRWEVFLETQNPNLKPVNWRSFLPYIGHKTRSSCHTGIIKLQNQEFLLGQDGKIAFSNDLVKLMTQVEGKELDIYWLDGNDGQVMKALVYLKDSSQFVCEAVAKPRYNRARIEQTADDARNRELMSMYVASVDGWIRERKNELEHITVIDNRPKTINNKFKMPGLHDEEPDEERAPEVLDEPEEEEVFNDIDTGFKRGLKDIF